MACEYSVSKPFHVFTSICTNIYIHINFSTSSERLANQSLCFKTSTNYTNFVAAVFLRAVPNRIRRKKLVTKTFRFCNENIKYSLQIDPISRFNRVCKWKFCKLLDIPLVHSHLRRCAATHSEKSEKDKKILKTMSAQQRIIPHNFSLLSLSLSLSFSPFLN